MKTKSILLFATIALLLSGCFIKSLYPFYTKKDLVYDQTLTGTWLDNDSSKWVIKQQNNWPVSSSPEQSYQVEITDKDGKQCSFNVHLFRLNKQLYLDFYPSGKIGSNDIIEGNIVATHSIAKVGYNAKNIKVQWFNEIWFEQLLKQNRIRIRHEKLNNDGENNYANSYLITAPTEELQKFITKFGNDSLAFKSIWEADPKDRNKEALTSNLKKLSNATN
jgi:hypothetical protein